MMTQPMPKIGVATSPTVRNSPGAGVRAGLMLALLAASNAHAQLFKDDDLHNRVRQLESQRSSDARRLDGIDAGIDARIQAGVDKRAEILARQLLDLNSQVEALRQEIARMRGQIEVLTNEVENTAKRQRDFYVDLDGRVRRLEAPPAPEKPKGPTAEEQKAYEAGLNLVKAANYKGAIEAFGGFLKTYPQSTLAPSAQYWIGNSLFALRDYKGAITAQQHVVDTWPDDPKAPDAMLNISSAQTDLKDVRAARATLDALIKKYPQSEAAATARQRLPRLR